MALRFEVDTDAHASDDIDGKFFGGNFLVGRDSTTGTFAEKAEFLGLNLLRYPGGAIAEDHFDISNPNAPMPGTGETQTTLSEFLTYCAANDIAPCIVIPTKRYAEDVATGLADCRAFAQELAAGTYGPIDNLILQIGNEFYSDNSNFAAITENQYGDIASQFAVALHEELPETVTIGVQMGRRLPESQRILNHFDTNEERDAVDSIAVHQYPWTLDAVDGRMAKTVERVALWESTLGSLNIFMSEWNVGSSPDSSLDALHDYGLSQNPALLEIVFEAVVAGVDYGAIWGIQQRSKTALTGDEGEDDIWAAGHLYQMMAEDLIGKHALAQPTDIYGAQNVVAYAFEDDTSLSLYVAARDIDLSDGAVWAEIDLIGAGYTAVSAERISTTTIGNHPKPRAVLTDFEPEIVFENDGPVLRIGFYRDDEVVRLNFDKEDLSMVNLVRSGGGADDMLTGGLGADLIRGHTGDDHLVAHDGDDDARGGQGHDHIHGGAGADRIKGGSGADHLVGGSDNDIITGNAGRDQIFGGDGDDDIDGGVGRDRLFGGDGNDRLTGGGDNDRYWGGTGADTFVITENFGFDRIYDFTIGDDIIDFSSVSTISGLSDLLPLMTQDSRHTVITLTDGTLVLNKIIADTLSESDFIFL